ncbi:MAG: hypothetical protein ACK4GR_04325 [bacterium]
MCEIDIPTEPAFNRFELYLKMLDLLGSKDPYQRVRGIVIAAEIGSEYRVDEGANDPSYVVRKATARLTKNPDVIRKLLGDHDEEVLLGLLDNPHSPIWVLVGILEFAVTNSEEYLAAQTAAVLVQRGITYIPRCMAKDMPSSKCRFYLKKAAKRQTK